MLDGLEHKPAAAHAASRGTEPLPPIKEPGQHRTRWKARLGHDLRRSFHFSVIFLILVGLAACGSGGAADPGTRDPGPPDTDPADELPTVLKPGGTFLDETGGVISALQGALEEAVRVSVDLIDAPEEALPESAIAAGPHYLVRSEVDTVADEAPFLLALPVPADADPERLALALLIEPVDIEGMDLEGNAMWEFLPSLYDPDGQYLAAAVWELAESGRAIVLIESDEVEPPLVSEPPAGCRATA